MTCDSFEIFNVNFDSTTIYILLGTRIYKKTNIVGIIYIKYALFVQPYPHLVILAKKIMLDKAKLVHTTYHVSDGWNFRIVGFDEQSSKHLVHKSKAGDS